MTELTASAGLDSSVPSVRVATALDRYRDNIDRAVGWVHSSWIAASLGVSEAQLPDWRVSLADAPVAAAERCSRALVRALGVTPLGFPHLSQGGFASGGMTVAPQPNVCLLDVTPAPLTLQIWRMRALLLRRGEVRRLIDRHAQRRLADWTGLDMDALMSGSNTDSANDAARLAAVAMPPLASLDADALAVEGMLLVLRDVKCDGGLPFPLSRLALPRLINVPAWLNTLPTQHDEVGTARLFRRLPELLREWAWLFG
ncbi:type III secretion protein HrpB4 [Burkholderia metallica]|uniref:type III secretion protein HrpB4 n=1 Tax=Burkholderia metallica TaxID=488729 RepID=UPI001CF11B17|nr:type III secretion protein HrpB4 [Burkholderia metallica]MCA8023424.1 type III secretion protein HrpB4 [Burkholderia metallica]